MPATPLNVCRGLNTRSSKHCSLRRVDSVRTPKQKVSFRSDISCIIDGDLGPVTRRNTFLGIARAAIASSMLSQLMAQQEAFAADKTTTKAIAVLKGTSGNESVAGVVTFTQEENSKSVLVEAEVSGLKPGKHGFHVHAVGDISSADGSSAGGHFNPSSTKHGGPDGGEKHAGDLGNLEANAQGVAKINRTFTTGLSVSGPNSILGRSVVVHAGEDDFMTQPTGNSGGRVAYGVVGLASS